MRSNGMGMTEYGLVAALIGIVAISALMLLSTNVNALLDGMIPSRADATASLAARSAPVAPDPAPPTPRQPAFTGYRMTNASAARAGIATETVCYSQGICLAIPTIPKGATTATLGGNGSDFMASFADVLQQIADQLKKDPNADPEVVRLVTQLANRGHGYGDFISKTMETACKVRGKCVTQTRPPVLEGFTGKERDFRNALENDHKTLKEYVTQNPQVLTPDVMELIALEVKQINQVGRGNWFDGATMKNYSQWNMHRDPSLIHQSSNTICDNGGNRRKCWRYEG